MKVRKCVWNERKSERGKGRGEKTVNEWQKEGGNERIERRIRKRPVSNGHNNENRAGDINWGDETANLYESEPFDYIV